MIGIPGFSRRWRLTWASLGCTALVLTGMVLDPYRELLDFRLILFLWVTAGLSGLLILTMDRLTTAPWLRPFETVARTLADSLPASSILLFAVLVGGQLTGPARVQPAGFWTWWHSPVFLLARSAVYLSCWVLLTRVPLAGFRLSKGTVHRIGRGWAGLILGLIAATFWLASADWVMALSSGWPTTLSMVYSFSSLLVTAAPLLGLAVVTSLPRIDILAGHRGTTFIHDIGRFLLLTSSFWMGAWSCRYLLVAYSALPAQPPDGQLPTEGPWSGIFFLVPLLNWFVPCAILLSRRVPIDSRSLWQISILVMIGRWFDLYQIMLAEHGAFTLTHFLFDLAPTMLLVLLWIARGGSSRNRA